MKRLQEYKDEIEFLNDQCKENPGGLDYEDQICALELLEELNRELEYKCRILDRVSEDINQDYLELLELECRQPKK